MDLYKIINSQTVGNYLKEIGYSFSPLQAAFLIWYSMRLTIKEKHAMWEELIATMPDTPIEARHGDAPRASLHGFLRSYMTIENDLIERLYSTEADAYYTYDVYYRNDHSWAKDNGFYKTADDCFRELQEDADLGIRMIKLKKICLNAPNASLALYMTPEREVFRIDAFGVLSEDEDGIYNRLFDGLWFEFPLPFKKGDILQYCTCPYDPCTYRPEINSAVLLEDDLKPYDNMRKTLLTEGDHTEMAIRGFYCDELGKFYYESEGVYLDYELQYLPLPDDEKALIPLSNYFKGEISVDILCNAYHILLSERHSDDMRRYMNITDKGLELAGLKEQNGRERV